MAYGMVGYRYGFGGMWLVCIVGFILAALIFSIIFWWAYSLFVKAEETKNKKVNKK